MKWQPIMVRFDGVIERQGLRSLAPVARPSSMWEEVVRLPDLVIYVWIGPEKPGYARVAFYVRQ